MKYLLELIKIQIVSERVQSGRQQIFINGIVQHWKF